MKDILLDDFDVLQAVLTGEKEESVPLSTPVTMDDSMGLGDSSYEEVDMDALQVCLGHTDLICFVCG